MKTYLKYIGKGKGTIPGVPARDLMYEDVKNLDIVALIQSGLYVYVYEEDVLPTEQKTTKKKRSVKNGK